MSLMALSPTGSFAFSFWIGSSPLQTTDHGLARPCSRQRFGRRCSCTRFLREPLAELFCVLWGANSGLFQSACHGWNSRRSHCESCASL